jgi:hypothetical protein
MGDPARILSYAARNYAGEADAPDELRFVFERPRSDVGMRCVGIGTAIIGFVVVVGMTYDRYRHDALEPLLVFASALGIIAMTITAGACLNGLLRTWRFGDTPITIRVAEGHIIVSDPVWLGPRPRVLALAEVRRCTAEYERLTGNSLRPYRIVFRMRAFLKRRVSVMVAVAEKGIVERAAADMQRSIERSRSDEHA